MPTGCLRFARWAIIFISLGAGLILLLQGDALEALFLFAAAYIFWRAPVPED